jgi:hypothetical protein
MKTKLITAEEAREMRSMDMVHFLNNDMEKYIKYINKKIREETKNGMFGFELWYTHYVSTSPDPVISELSEQKMMMLISLLEENGYRAYLDRGKRLCVWWNKKEEPKPSEFEVVQHELTFKEPWYCFWRKS